MIWKNVSDKFLQKLGGEYFSLYLSKCLKISIIQRIFKIPSRVPLLLRIYKASREHHSYPKNKKNPDNLQNHNILNPLETWVHKATKWTKFQRVKKPSKEKREHIKFTFGTAWKEGLATIKVGKKKTAKLLTNS